MKNVLDLVRYQWDRVLAGVSIALGALVLLLGWLGVSRNPYPAGQIPYILSGGLFGIFLLGLGVQVWLSADLKDEWRKLDRIEHLLAGRDIEEVAADLNAERAANAPAIEAPTPDTSDGKAEQNGSGRRKTRTPRTASSR